MIRTNNVTRLNSVNEQEFTNASSLRQVFIFQFVQEHSFAIGSQSNTEMCNTETNSNHSKAHVFQLLLLEVVMICVDELQYNPEKKGGKDKKKKKKLTKSKQTAKLETLDLWAIDLTTCEHKLWMLWFPIESPHDNSNCNSNNTNQ